MVMVGLHVRHVHQTAAHLPVVTGFHHVLVCQDIRGQMMAVYNVNLGSISLRLGLSPALFVQTALLA